MVASLWGPAGSPAGPSGTVRLRRFSGKPGTVCDDGPTGSATKPERPMPRSRLIIIVVVIAVASASAASSPTTRSCAATAPRLLRSRPRCQRGSAAATSASPARAPPRQPDRRAPPRPRASTGASRAPGTSPTGSVGRVSRPRAAGQLVRRERCGRPHGPGDRLDHARDVRVDDEPDRGVADGRHDLDHLGQVAARQPAARPRASRPTPSRRRRSS